jgi:hypothetical protein
VAVERLFAITAGTVLIGGAKSHTSSEETAAAVTV